MAGMIRRAFSKIGRAAPRHTDATAITAEDYLNGHFGEVEGFFDLVDARLFLFFHMVHKGEKIGGDIFEIGVHQGKSALLLALFIDPEGELLHVSDLFEEQEMNVSRSGLGSRDLFLGNMGRIVGDTPFLRIHEGPSQGLDPGDFPGRNVRIFHIDGGHSAAETYSDLKFANEVVSAKGVIIVDDFFNRKWPGVSEGATRFLIDHQDLSPVMIGSNKVFFVNKKATALYREWIEGDAFMGFVSRHGLRFEHRNWMGERVLLMESGTMFGCEITTRRKRCKLKKGEMSFLPITIRNLSHTTLHSKPGAPIFVSYHLLDHQGNTILFDNSRTAIEKPIPRGARASLNLEVDKIDKRGKYIVEVDCVYEGLTWFKESGSRTLKVEVEVV